MSFRQCSPEVSNLAQRPCKGEQTGRTRLCTASGTSHHILDADRHGRTVASIARALSDTVRNIPIDAGDATAEIGALGELFQLAAAEIRRQDHPVPPTAGANPGA